MTQVSIPVLLFLWRYTGKVLEYQSTLCTFVSALLFPNGIFHSPSLGSPDPSFPGEDSLRPFAGLCHRAPRTCGRGTEEESGERVGGGTP